MKGTVTFREQVNEISQVIKTLCVELSRYIFDSANNMIELRNFYTNLD